jgi:hypothetical protein
MRVLFIALCLAGFAVSWATAGEPVGFTQTEAAQAFEQKRYPKAEKEFLRLLETNPDNLLILRYLAMTYDRQGRYTEALRTYLRALKLAPRNVALLYHSGETMYHAHYADAARRHFQLVLQFAPDTEYATLARQHLDALSQQRVARQSPGAPRRFGVYAELSVCSAMKWSMRAPTECTRDVSKSTRMTEYVSLEAYLLRRADWVINLEASGYGAQYVEDEDDRKDIWQYSAGGLIQRSGRLGAVPVVGTLRGSEQWVQFDGGPDYSESSSGTAGLQAGLTRQTTTRVYYRFTDDRFEEKGFDPATILARRGESCGWSAAHVPFPEATGAVHPGRRISGQPGGGPQLHLRGTAVLSLPQSAPGLGRASGCELSIYGRRLHGFCRPGGARNGAARMERVAVPLVRSPCAGATELCGSG